MPEINIQELEWDATNQRHIWEQHQLTSEIVEEVCYGNPDGLHAEMTDGGRYLVIGPKRGGKLFAVVLAPKGAGRFYPVTARRANQKERRAYREWKMGKLP